MSNKTTNLRLVGMVGGVILLLGVLLVASQYVADFTGGASADVVNYDLVPAEVTISKEEYRMALDKVAEYRSKTDLASKNEIIQELAELMSGWGRY